nr:MAG TPA: hypothetical protein [Caudoviricetes sp.]
MLFNLFPLSRDRTGTESNRLYSKSPLTSFQIT